MIRYAFSFHIDARHFRWYAIILPFRFHWDYFDIATCRRNMPLRCCLFRHYFFRLAAIDWCHFAIFAAMPLPHFLHAAMPPRWLRPRLRCRLWRRFRFAFIFVCHYFAISIAAIFISFHFHFFFERFRFSLSHTPLSPFHWLLISSLSPFFCLIIAIIRCRFRFRLRWFFAFTLILPRHFVSLLFFFVIYFLL